MFVCACRFHYRLQMAATRVVKSWGSPKNDFFYKIEIEYCTKKHGKVQSIFLRGNPSKNKKLCKCDLLPRQPNMEWPKIEGGAKRKRMFLSLWKWEGVDNEVLGYSGDPPTDPPSRPPRPGQTDSSSRYFGSWNNTKMFNKKRNQKGKFWDPTSQTRSDRLQLRIFSGNNVQIKRGFLKSCDWPSQTRPDQTDSSFGYLGSFLPPHIVKSLKWWLFSRLSPINYDFGGFGLHIKQNLDTNFSVFFFVYIFDV